MITKENLEKWLNKKKKYLQSIIETSQTPKENAQTPKESALDLPVRAKRRKSTEVNLSYIEHRRPASS